MSKSPAKQASEKAWKEAHRAELLAGKKAWHAANKARANERSREWREAHRELANERSREWYHSNKDRARAYNAANRDRYRAHSLKNNFARRGIVGATVEYYDALFESQGGACAICRRMWSTGERLFPLDHCHSTKRLRGILCNGCNVGLGALQDTPYVLEAAADYLRRNGCGE